MSSKKGNMGGGAESADGEPLIIKWHISEEEMKETPSVKRGMSPKEEMEYRRRGIRFIKYMMRYLTFEKVIQGNTLDQTKTPRVFPTAVHMFHRFYTIHPFQIFNEYVTAVACVFHALKVEEHILPIARILDLARVNAKSLLWVKLPEELSFENDDWASLWKNEVSETEFLLFTTVNPMRFLFINVYGFILMFLKKWSGAAIKEEEACKVRDRAFTIASDVYSCGCPIIVTESTKLVASMCLMIALKHVNLNITTWHGKQQHQRYWYHVVDPSLTIEKLKEMETSFLAHLKQYNLVKKMEEKKPKGVSPSSDYGSEGSITSNPVSPSDSMCSDRDAMSNEPTSPAASTSSSVDQGLGSSLDGKDYKRRPVVLKKTDLAPPCQVSLSMRRGDISLSSKSSSSSTYIRQTRKLDMPMISPIEPVQKKMKIHSPIRYP